MSEITPEPATVADPSHPRWAPPDGNTITVDTEPLDVEAEGGFL